MSSWLVVVAAVLQYLLAATFVIMPGVAYRYGTPAQRAAEAEVERQGAAGSVLTRHQVKFTESAIEALLPLGIALCLAVLATLNLAGSDTGRILTWILQPIMLVGGGLTTAGQVFPVRYVQAAFRKSGDPQARGLDVAAVIHAASDAFPSWLRATVLTRFLLTTAGSVLIIVLLSLPPASAHFH